MSILNLPGLESIDIKETNQHYQITAKATHPPIYCPNCQSSEIVRFGGREKFFFDTPIHGKQAGIVVKRNRYSCKSCHKTFTEPLPMMDEKRSATKRLVGHIEKNSLDKTFVSISAEVGVHEKTVRNIFTEYVEKLESKYKITTPRWLGIDEIHIIKRPRCVISNIEDRTVVNMLSNRNKVTVKQYLAGLPDRDRIEYVCMDMWNPCKEAVNDVLPGRKIVVDKFHTVRMANQALETVRKSLRKQLRDRERRTLKDDRRILLKRNYDLRPDEILKLEVWTKNYPALGSSYDLKEWFYNIWDSRDRQEAEERYDAWVKSIPAEFESTWAFVLKAVGNWREEIFAYFDHPNRITNAFTESLNSLIRITNRMGRGYSFEVLRAKILFSSLVKRSNKTIKYPKRNFPMPAGMMGLMTTEPEKETYAGVEISTLIKMIELGDL